MRGGLVLCVLVFSLLLGLLICCCVSPKGFGPYVSLDIVSGGCVILSLYLSIPFFISCSLTCSSLCKYFLYLKPPALVFVSVYPPNVCLTPSKSVP